MSQEVISIDWEIGILTVNAYLLGGREAAMNALDGMRASAGIGDVQVMLANVIEVSNAQDEVCVLVQCSSAEKAEKAATMLRVRYGLSSTPTAAGTAAE
jgi:hypothetical protein